jgi:hypothetical protein
LKLYKICTQKLPKVLDNACFTHKQAGALAQLRAAQPAPCTLEGGVGPGGTSDLKIFLRKSNKSVLLPFFKSTWFSFETS